MRQLRYLEPGRVSWREIPEPTLTSPEAAVARPIAVGTCDLDGLIVRGETPAPGPFALGHEFVAEIVEVGAQVSTLSPGQRVTVPFQINCGSCANCRAGRTGRCTSVPIGSTFGLGPFGSDPDGSQWGGALADLVTVPFAEAMCLRLPAGADPVAMAGVSDNAVDGWRTVAPHLVEGGRAEHDRRVLVFGVGSIGLYAAAFGVALGADVTYVDPSEPRCVVAERLGASVRCEPVADRYPSHPVVAHTSSTVPGLMSAIRSTEPDGVCTDTGLYFQPVELPLLQMYTKGITFVTGRVNARADMPGVLSLVESGAVDLTPIVTQTASWDDAPEAWAAHHGRLVVTR
jgi:threonine dehydrogenase-like Zn-dependent dehydrogenase